MAREKHRKGREAQRKKGEGLGQVNRVLRAWMLGRVAKIIDGPDTTDYILHPERIEDDQKLPRPEWGDTEALLERISKSLRERDGEE